MLLNMSFGRRNLTGLLVLMCTILSILTFLRSDVAGAAVIRVLGGDRHGDKPRPTPPTYKPAPTYTPPPVRDPFPLLATSTPAPVPKWNAPREGLHAEYGLPTPPPLLIGFTRGWPLLLQAVVGYITAGWPPSQIYVVENTGTQQANARGQLGLQNPFFLNHTALRRLGVNVIQTPVLLSFAQLQNFYLSLTYERDWPYFFWSHMDVLVLSYEEGFPGVTGPYDAPDYKTIYELCCAALADARDSPATRRWGMIHFAYDHLALVNPAAYEAVGGWDTLIPYYMTDCDFYTRMRMANWTIEEAKAGVITDVSSTLTDLRAFYRDRAVEVDFVDPNPPPPPPEPKPKPPVPAVAERGEAGGPLPVVAEKKTQKRGEPTKEDEEDANKKKEGISSPPLDPELEYWRALLAAGDRMYHYKHGERGRNTWQRGQRGGFGEPFYYPAEGVDEGIEAVTDAGREVFRRKWGVRGCDDLSGSGMRLWDQWRVEQSWED